MHEQEQRLAITIVGLLLVGEVLINQAPIGTWATFSTSAAIILCMYAGPRVAHELAVQRLRRWLGRRPMP